MRFATSTGANSSSKGRAPIRFSVFDSQFNTVTKCGARYGFAGHVPLVYGGTAEMPLQPMINATQTDMLVSSPSSAGGPYDLDAMERYNYKATYHFDSITDDGSTPALWAGVSYGNPLGTDCLRAHVRYRGGTGLVLEIESIVASVTTLLARFLLSTDNSFDNLTVSVGTSRVYWSGVGPDPQESAPGDPATDGAILFWVELTGSSGFTYVVANAGVIPVPSKELYTYMDSFTAYCIMVNPTLVDVGFTNGLSFVLDAFAGDGGYNTSVMYHAMNCREESDGSCKFLLKPEVFEYIDGDVLVNGFAGGSALGAIAFTDETAQFRKTGRYGVQTFDIAPHNPNKVISQTMSGIQGPRFAQVLGHSSDGDLSFSVVRPEGSEDTLESFEVTVAASGKIEGKDTKRIRTVPEVMWSNDQSELSASEWGWASPVNYGLIRSVASGERYKYCVAKTLFIESTNILLVYYLNAGNDGEIIHTFEHASEFMVDRYDLSVGSAPVYLDTTSLISSASNCVSNPTIESTNVFDPYVSFKLVEVDNAKFMDQAGTTTYGRALFAFWTSSDDCTNLTLSFRFSFDDGATWEPDDYKVSCSHFELFAGARIHDFDVDYCDGRFAFAVTFTDQTTRLRSESMRAEDGFLRTFTIDGSLFSDNSVLSTTVAAPNNTYHAYPHHDFYAFDMPSAKVNLVRPKIRADKLRNNFWMVVHNDAPATTGTAFVYASKNGASWSPVYIPAGRPDDNVTYNPDVGIGEIQQDYTHTNLDPEWGSKVIACDVLHHEDGFLYVALEVDGEYRTVVHRLSPKFLSAAARWAKARLRTRYIDTFTFDTRSGEIADNTVQAFTSTDQNDATYHMSPYFRAFYQQAIDNFGGVEILRFCNSDKHLVGDVGTPEFGQSLVEISRLGHCVCLSTSSHDVGASTADSPTRAWAYIATAYRGTSYGSRATNQYGALGANIFEFCSASGVYDMWSKTTTGGGTVAIAGTTYPDATRIEVSLATDEAICSLDLQQINNNQGLPQYQELDGNLSQWNKRVRVVYAMNENMTSSDRFSVSIQFTDADGVGVHAVVLIGQTAIEIHEGTVDAYVTGGTPQFQSGIRCADIYLIRTATSGGAEVTVSVYESEYDANFGFGFQQRNAVCSGAISAYGSVSEDRVDVGFTTDFQYWTDAQTKSAYLYDISVGHGSREGEYSVSTSSNNVGVPVASQGQRLWLSGDVILSVFGTKGTKSDYVSYRMDPHFSPVRALEFDAQNGMRFGSHDGSSFDEDFEIVITVAPTLTSYTGASDSKFSSTQLSGGILILKDTNIKEFSVSVIDGDDNVYDLGRYTLLRALVNPQIQADNGTSTIDSVPYPNRAVRLMSSSLSFRDSDYIGLQAYQYDSDTNRNAAYIADCWSDTVTFSGTTVDMTSVSFRDGGDSFDTSTIAVYERSIWLDLNSEFDFKSVNVAQVVITVHYSLTMLRAAIAARADVGLPLIPTLEGPNPYRDNTPERYWSIGTIDYTKRYNLGDRLSSIEQTISVPSVAQVGATGQGDVRAFPNPLVDSTLEWTNLTQQHYMRAAEAKNQIAKTKYVWLLPEGDRSSVHKTVVSGEVRMTRQHVESTGDLASTLNIELKGTE